MNDSKVVELKLGFGWVVVTPDSDGPFVIGPFDDEPTGWIWRTNIAPDLVEDIDYLGGTAIFFPESYAEISQEMKARQQPGPPGDLSR